MSDGIFSKFKEYSVAEFFKKNRQMLGFSGKVRSLTTIVHEYVTNSLDACGEAGIYPEIEVWVGADGEDRYRVKVRDNGPGIPKTHIGKALGMMLAGTKFNRYAQQRGQQGIGATGCTMYALITTGKPIRVSSSHEGKKIECEVGIDFKNNKPVITPISEGPAEGGKCGLEIEGVFGGVRHEKSAYGVYEYLRRTAIANPHATIIYNSPEGERFVFPKSVDLMPTKPAEVKPHPLGISAHDLIEKARGAPYQRISAFLQEEFTRVSLNKVKELQEAVPDVDLGKKPSEMSWEEAERLVGAFRKVKWIAPATDSVVPIGAEQVEKSLNSIIGPEYIFVTRRSPKIYRGGIPFMVEAALAYNGKGANGEILRFANRAPLLFDAGGCSITQAVKSIDWKRYGIKNLEEEPLSIFVHFASVHVPYTSAGKQSISDEEEVVDEIKNSVMEAARGLDRHLSGKRRVKEAAGKRAAILRYVGQLSKDMSELGGVGADAAKVKERLLKMVEGRYGAGGAAAEEEEGEAPERGRRKVNYHERQGGI
ncbi:MAG: DNA topoisomerase VI subunit B [Candidatus ainarchaeum sp.]|nr:DNA topoisomerase VI subunit B [Candidatus ainarchaeum sp.]